MTASMQGKVVVITGAASGVETTAASTFGLPAAKIARIVVGLRPAHLTHSTDPIRISPNCMVVAP